MSFDEQLITVSTGYIPIDTEDSLQMQQSVGSLY